MLFHVLSHYSLLQDIEYISLLYNRFLLCIYFTYSSVYLLFPNSQFIPPFLPSLVTISLFSMIGDYFCFVYKFMCHFFF